MIEVATYILLTTAPAVTAKVNDRIVYAERTETHTLPAVIIQRGSENQTHHLKGNSGRTSGLIRVTCLASSYLGASDLARVVNDRLDAFVGTVNIRDDAGQLINLRVRHILHDGQDDIPSDHRDGQGQALTFGVETNYRYAYTTPH